MTEPRFGSVSVIAVVTKQRFLRYQLIKGNGKTNIFGSFLLRLINNSLEIVQNREICTINGQCSDTPHEISSTVAQQLYNSFYCTLQPILQHDWIGFSQIKRHFRQSLKKNAQTLRKLIAQCAEVIEQRHLEAFYNHTLSNYEACLQLKDIWMNDPITKTRSLGYRFTTTYLKCLRSDSWSVFYALVY